MDLEKFRDEINAVDNQLLELLARRRQLVGNVIELKQSKALQLRDVHREEELLGRLIASGRKLGLDAHAVTKIFHEIIDDSVRSQQLFLQRNHNQPPSESGLTVVYQGVAGNFSDAAARQVFSEQADRSIFTGVPAFEDVVRAVERGEADFGLLPVENTTAGVINEVYDLLLRTKLSIVGEDVFQIHLCLLAVEKIPMSNVRRVVSQWQALAQCSRFLSQLDNCQKVPMIDTAMAVRKVKDDQDLSQAAIAGEESARMYGLKVLKRNISDELQNFTRFIVVARDPVTVDLRIPAKTSLIVATLHQSGALMKALAVLERHGINMTKLESRPRKGSRFEYVFYVDIEGNVSDPRIEAALVELRAATSFVKILGTYPIEDRQRTSPTIASLVGQRDTVGSQESSVSIRSATGTGTRPGGGIQIDHQLVSRETKPEDTVINVRGVEIGGADCVIIAGPSVVESERQIHACARQVKECGGKILSGACFRPRLAPEGVQGLGFEGLKLLAEAGRQYELPVVTEVLSPADAEQAAELADILMIGHQNMQNYSLLSELGGMHRVVMLRRGLSASLEQLLEAAEYLLEQGSQQVLLCEHGISTFEATTRNTLDLGGIAILKRLTHLPIVVDPSDTADRSELVAPLAKAAHAVGADGLMFEIDPDPEHSFSRHARSLSFSGLCDLISEVFC